MKAWRNRKGRCWCNKETCVPPAEPVEDIPPRETLFDDTSIRKEQTPPKRTATRHGRYITRWGRYDGFGDEHR